MNERIKKQIRGLAEQAGGFPCSQDEWGFYNKGLEKFAELIVKERLAAWMIKEGFATGHGDTVEQLLEELSWQVAEIKARRDELLAALQWYADTVEDLNRNGWTAGKALGQLRADRGKRAMEAIAKAKGENNE